MSAPYRLKRPRGFFAAGAEFESALLALGDGAFKVYAWACLRAERSSGRLAFDRADLARRLGRSRSALGRHLRELARAGVCDLEAAPNQHRGSVLAVRPAYWPYLAADAARDAAESGPDAAAYVAAVRQAFLGPSCVQGDFGPADERLADAWRVRGVPLETVRRALLLGCARKSMSLIDRPDAQPVRSLRYFEPLLREVGSESFPGGYWKHLEYNLGRCEDYWRARPATAPGRARSNSEQAGAAPGAGVSPAAPERKGKTR